MRVILLCVLWLGALAVSAQESTGAISGHVQDAAGAMIAGSEVTATHRETGAARKTVTDADGSYTFTALPIGGYQIAVAHAGFKKAVRGGLEVHVGDHLSIDIRLEVGELVQEVSVVANAPQVETESSESGGLISGEQVRELQLNGRSFMTLVELLPGVSSDMPDRTDPGTSTALSINGSRSSGASYNIDGGNNSDVIVGGGSLNTFTSVDTIAEFKVLTSTFPAEFGRGGFSHINVVTRGGTQRFRGSLYHFFRNDKLDARDYCSHQVLPLKLNNFGYTIGGPLLLPWGFNRSRKKTFFFFTQEFNRISTRGTAVNTTVPTEAERRGDFSGRGAGRDGRWETADDPVVDPLTGVGFPGGIIPPSRIDRNKVKLINLYPLPNFVGPGAINYTSAAPSQQHWREELIRIDHIFSPGWKMYARYAKDSAFVRNPYGGWQPTSVGTRFPGISTTHANRPGQNLTVNVTTVGRRWLNEFVFTYAGREITQSPALEEADRTKLGIDIPELFPENDGNVIPTVNLGSGYAALNVSRVWLKQLFNLEVSNNVSRVLGKHIFKTGALYTYGGNRENPTSPNTNGSFSFNTSFSKSPVANMLLGMPYSYTEAERFVVSRARFAMFEAFAQDDYRATRRLTLNVGLRYSAYFNPWDTHDVLSNFLPQNFDPARAREIDPRTGRLLPGTGDPLNGVVLAGKDSPYGRKVTENNTDLLGPRFGFAWDLFGKKKTALRGGYGVFFTRPLIGTFINNAFDNPPFSRSVTLLLGGSSDLRQGAEEAPTSVSNVTALGVPMLAPTTQQWKLGIQRETPLRHLVDVSYVASHGTHLFRPLNINSPEPGVAAAQGVHVNYVRPYRGWGSITQRQSTACSTYHSLQVTVNRRMARTLSYGIAYTFSKSIDNASSDRGSSDIPPDSRDARRERGLSDHDRRHIFTANYIWYLPRFVRRGRLRWVVNGWQVSGITRLNSGTPFDVVLSQDVAGVGSTQNQRPDLIAGPRGPRTVEEWFNRNAFARPASGTFGNMGRNTLIRPGMNKWDLSLFKNFAFKEGRSLQFRSEFFNAPNHPTFTTVGSSLTTTATGVNPAANSFAVITATRDARVLQFALKLNF